MASQCDQVRITLSSPFAIQHQGEELGHDAGRPYYTVKLIWTFSYPSESWIARRTLAGGITAAIGMVIIWFGDYGRYHGPLSWVGLSIAVLAWGYGAYLTWVGYANTRRRREAQGLPPEK